MHGLLQWGTPRRRPADIRAGFMDKPNLGDTSTSPLLAHCPLPGRVAAMRKAQR